MNKSSIRGLLGSGLLTLPVLLGGITAVPNEAQALENVRLCYVSSNAGPTYFMRLRVETGWIGNYPYFQYNDCSDYDGYGDYKGKDVPVLYRDGAYHDMSICENFSKYLLNFDGDICEYMDPQRFYSKEQLESLVR